MRALNHITSAVDRVVEPPDLWTQRVSKTQFGDRIPHIERSSEGEDCWVIDQRKFPLAKINIGALLTDRAASIRRWDEVPASAYDAAERLGAMDQDSVATSVLYPTVGGFSGAHLTAISDPELQLACVRAYNDWIIENWTSKSARFIAQCLVPLARIDDAVGEIRRAVGLGHRGVIFPAAPMHLSKLPHINDAAYDPIWAVCEELNVPVCFHAGSAPDLFQFPAPGNLSPELAAALDAVTRPPSSVFDLTNILFSRILLRFAKLKVVFAESTIGWGTYLLEYADHQYEQDHCDYPLKPSEMFHRQCYLTTWCDDVKIHARHVGIDNILWASNFPAANSTWPETQNFLSQRLAGLNEAEQQRIVSTNAAKLYNVKP
jgi:predicted TIM-barrel fold metal-dependent hydrolase